MAVHTPFKSMNNVMMTSYNCCISHIFQSFHNAFIKMHQNVNKTLLFEEGKSEFSYSKLRQSHMTEALCDDINNKYLHLR